MSFTATPIKSDQVPANQLTPQTGQPAPQTGAVTPPVGAGVNGATNGATPPPGGAAADIGTAYASLINVFAPPGAANVDISVLVAAAMSKILASVGEAANRKTEAYNAERQEVYSKKLQEIKAAIDELSKVKDTSIWDKIECACKIVAGALLIVLGIVAEVIPGLGQVGGTLTIVVGAMLLAEGVEQATEMATGHSLLGNTVRILGCSEDTANDCDWLNEKALLVAEVAVAIYTLGGSSALTSGARIVTLVAALVEATGKVVVAVINKQNDDHREQANRHKASEAELQSVTDQIAAYYEQAIENLMQSSKARGDTLQTTFTTLQAKGNGATHVRFATV